MTKIEAIKYAIYEHATEGTDRMFLMKKEGEYNTATTDSVKYAQRCGWTVVGNTVEEAKVLNLI